MKRGRNNTMNVKVANLCMILNILWIRIGTVEIDLLLSLMYDSESSMLTCNQENLMYSDINCMNSFREFSLTDLRC